ncbi:MAG: ABC transporter ATP-binding protein [Chloroflexi bacterium]|nr:ABC transporter ATP-binding protein [Chloroflexota bacterium]
MLTCHNVIKDFGGVRALAGVTITVHEGEIVGLVGPNGSGKSTLINNITGLTVPTAGGIQFLGQEIAGNPPHRINHMGIARTYQIPRPFSTMTVRENVEISALFGMTQGISQKEAKQQAIEWLDFTGLSSYANLPVTKLNLHQRKFLELSRALATKPSLLLLDEVMAGLNPSEIDESVKMIRKVHSSGVTIVIVEHLMRVVTSLSTRMVVLDQGRVIAEGLPETVMKDPLVVGAYLGKDYA